MRSRRDDAIDRANRIRAARHGRSTSRHQLDLFWFRKTEMRRNRSFVQHPNGIEKWNGPHPVALHGGVVLPRVLRDMQVNLRAPLAGFLLRPQQQLPGHHIGRNWTQHVRDTAFVGSIPAVVDRQFVLELSLADGRIEKRRVTGLPSLLHPALPLRPIDFSDPLAQDRPIAHCFVHRGNFHHWRFIVAERGRTVAHAFHQCQCGEERRVFVRDVTHHGAIGAPHPGFDFLRQSSRHRG